MKGLKAMDAAKLRWGCRIAAAALGIVLAAGFFAQDAAASPAGMHKAAGSTGAYGARRDASSIVIRVIDQGGAEVAAFDADAADMKTGLQRALSYAGTSATADNHMTVRVPAGSYMVDGTLHIASNTTLDLSDGATLRRSRETTLIQFSGDGGYGEGSCENISIIGSPSRDCVLDGNAMGKGVLRFGHANNILVKDVHFTNVKQAHHMEFTACRDVRVESCIFDGFSTANKSDKTNYEALQMDILLASHSGGFDPYDGTITRDVVITGNRFENLNRGVGTHSAKVGEYLKNIEISNNTFRNIEWYAITTVNYEGAKITGNKIQNCGAGIFFRSSSRYNYYPGDEKNISGDSDSLIADNEITVKDTGAGYERFGIYLAGEKLNQAVTWSSGSEKVIIPKGDYRVKNAAVRGNKVNISEYGHAIRLQGSSGCAVEKNTIKVTPKGKREVACNGIFLEASESNSVKGNVITDQNRKKSFMQYAICLKGESNGNLVKGNRLQNIWEAGICVEASKDNEIDGNKVSNAVNGIFINNGGNKGYQTLITGNTVQNMQTYGICGSDGTNMTVTGNTVKKGGWYGVSFGLGASGLVQGNKISGSENGDIDVKQPFGENVGMPAGNMTSAKPGKGRITLRWKSAPGADSYLVYRSNSKGGTYKKVATVKGTSYADSAKGGKTYYYKVAPQKMYGKVAVAGQFSSAKGAKAKK